MKAHIFLDLLRPHTTISLIGMCKNAGKTTVLNRCLLEYNGVNEVLGLTSIGRDGEAVDLVTKTAKPSIYVHRGALIATASELLPYCDISREVLECTGLSTPMGEVVIVRALSDGHVQLGGPSTVSQLIDVRERFFRHGASRVFIDGALSRKTLCTRALSDAAVLCTGASLEGGMDHVIEQTAFFCTLAALPVFSDKALSGLFRGISEAKWTLIGEKILHSNQPALFSALREQTANRTHTLFALGALTDAMVDSYIRTADLAPITIVVSDSSKLLLSRGSFQRLITKKCRFVVLDRINLVAVTVNPFSAYGNPFPPEEFLAAMSKAVSLPVFNVKEKMK